MNNKIVFLIFILFISNFTFLISNSSIAFAIEVGGHLTEDTTWSPENNPYLVTEILYVDAGVTLTILPGTEVKISGAPLTSYYEFDQNFWLYNGVSIAKMLWVDGRIIAEGTEQDSIIFTRMQDDPDFYWGTIYITEQADMSRFKFCEFEYSVGIGIAVGNIAYGAISFYNGLIISENNVFLNNASGIIGSLGTKRISIINNIFFYNNNINTFVQNSLWKVNIQVRKPFENYKPALIANNECVGKYWIVAHTPHCVDNTISGNNSVGITCAVEDEPGFFFNNNFVNCSTGILSNDGTDDSLYIKNNRFIGGIDGINIDYGYVEISDNYFEECDLDTGFNTSGLVFNNIINSGSAYGPGIVHFFNNISYNNENGIGICATSQRLSCTNNISMNNLYAFEASASFNNCIFIGNEELEQFSVTGNPIFRNCIIDFQLDPPLIDGGGNIWVDSVQAQELFEDIENGNFHLIEGSLAIDAGFDTLGYYYPFDMDYNTRVWDGDNNGSAIIDIGPYELGAPAFGGIEGYIYNPTTGEPVDYVLLKINNQPGEFTFTDSIGNFEYKLPAGIYDVYAERVFYEDVIEYHIEVIDGEFTQIAIPMFETVDVNEPIIPNSSFQISNLTNFPNPFNPTTTISFSVTQNSDFVNLEVYNIKGQKVKDFSPSLCHPEFIEGRGITKYSVTWNGTDQNNKPVASGIYFYKLDVNGKTKKTKKMLLLK